MIDIETLSTQANAHILTIAARVFHPHEGPLWEPLELSVSMADQGRHIDPGTVAWWGQQSPEARAAAFGDGPTLAACLRSLWDWMKFTESRRVWCKGPSFDAVILEDAYRQLQLGCPWRFHQVRDVRTIVELAGIKLPRTSTEHDALADVDHQIAEVVAAYKVLRC